jgi:hypothetical protein
VTGVRVVVARGKKRRFLHVIAGIGAAEVGPIVVHREIVSSTPKKRGRDQVDVTLGKRWCATVCAVGLTLSDRWPTKTAAVEAIEVGHGAVTVPWWELQSDGTMKTSVAQAAFDRWKQALRGENEAPPTSADSANDDAMMDQFKQLIADPDVQRAFRESRRQAQRDDEAA